MLNFNQIRKGLTGAILYALSLAPVRGTLSLTCGLAHQVVNDLNLDKH